MNHFLKSIALLSAGIAVFSISCKKESTVVEPNSISLAQSSLSINIGESDTLKVIYSPLNVTNKVITFSSSNINIATVSSSGIVTGIGNGIDTIKAITGDNKTSLCIVSVQLVNLSSLFLKSDTFWNGSNLSGGFTCGNAFFQNTYTPAYSSWTGFAYSDQHDTVTVTNSPDYNYQYYIDVAESPTNIFAIAYVSDSLNITFTKPINQVSLNVANDSYTAISMRNGDAYAKKFGVGDWFKVTITGYSKKNNVGTTTAYLADFRTAPYYILNTWELVNLSSFGTVDELSFKLSSSDNGAYGMNTPSYFCLDNIEGVIVN
jgi:hypothetical protein